MGHKLWRVANRGGSLGHSLTDGPGKPDMTLDIFGASECFKGIKMAYRENTQSKAKK